MLRIDSLETLGARVAAISGRQEGDCGGRASDPNARARFLAACGLSTEQLAVPKQVHGAAVLPVDFLHLGPQFNHEADGLITRTPGHILGISVADCVPVILFDPEFLAAGLAHAGRAGTLANISGAAVAALTRHYGCVPTALHAYIGPSAGPCCYEVSEAMAEEFRAKGLPTQGRMLDLWQANQHQLIAAGVPTDQIKVAAHCTICGEGFFSFRHGDKTGRNLALIAV